MDEVIILIAWHNETDESRIKAFDANRQTFIEHNPGVKIFTVINHYPDSNKAWLSSDLSLFSWYIRNKELVKSNRFVLIEWDCWCDCSIECYYNRVWDCDFVVPCVKYPERDDWYWFEQIKEIPERARPYAVGITPFCGILISNRAFDAISKEIFDKQYKTLNSELRLGTIATMLNFDPVVNPVYSRSLCWRTPRFGSKYKGLHHPRKAL